MATISGKVRPGKIRREDIGPDDIAVLQLIDSYSDSGNISVNIGPGNIAGHG